jgi:4-carboxymuconolactone decarboxylase
MMPLDGGSNSPHSLRPFVAVAVSPMCVTAAAKPLNKNGRAMDNNLFEVGLAKRKATLGAEYVEKSLDAADDFSRPFQEAMTAWCWGFGWGDEAIDAKTRSMMNLTMIGALGKMTEWELHCRGAIKNGVTREELRAIIHVIGIYCGVPQALECMRAARKAMGEDK